MIQFLCLFIYFMVCVCARVHMGVVHSAQVEVRGQFVGVSSLLSPCRFPGLNSGHQARCQVPLPAEPSYQLPYLFSKSHFKTDILKAKCQYRKNNNPQIYELQCIRFWATKKGIYNPSTGRRRQEDWVQSQPGLHRKTLSQNKNKHSHIIYLFIYFRTKGFDKINLVYVKKTSFGCFLHRSELTPAILQTVWS